MINWYKERCQKALHWNSRKDKLTFIPVQLMAHKFAKLKGVVSQQSSSLSVIFLFTHPFSLFNLTITQKLLLRTFAPIATAHFFAHVTHTSCIAGHEGKHDAKGANMERESVWHHGIAVDPGLLGNVTQ